MENIETGDLIEFIDAETDYSDPYRKTIHVSKFGIWDREKVILNDRDQTTVYNKKWLKLIEKNFNWACSFDQNNRNCLILSDGKNKTYIAIPPGKYRTDLISFDQKETKKGYSLNFNGIVIISSNSDRKAYFKGLLLAETKIHVR
jgi:hypothetical protein